MKLSPIFLVLLLCSSPLVQARSIYGKDDRVDFFKVTNPIHVKASEATAAMIPNSAFSSTAKNTILIQAKSYGEKNQLCKDERFYSQPSASDCSGFLIADDLLVTAGHCTQGQDICSSHQWVFGYRVTHDLQASVEVPAENLYHCQVVKEHFDFEHFVDYSVLKLDRKVVGYTPIQLAKNLQSKGKTPLVLAGFPRGLPLKLAQGRVYQNYPDYYVTNLDAFSGNSGSLVFNALTGEAEGILSAGAGNFEDSPEGCQRVKHFRDRDALEYVTRIHFIAEYLQSQNH